MEPPTVEVHDGLAGPRGFGQAPPSRNTSNTVSLAFIRLYLSVAFFAIPIGVWRRFG
jgi:hypothetical protein